MPFVEGPAVCEPAMNSQPVEKGTLAVTTGRRREAIPVQDREAWFRLGVAYDHPAPPTSTHVRLRALRIIAHQETKELAPLPRRRSSFALVRFVGRIVRLVIMCTLGTSVMLMYLATPVVLTTLYLVHDTIRAVALGVGALTCSELLVLRVVVLTTRRRTRGQHAEIRRAAA